MSGAIMLYSFFVLALIVLQIIAYWKIFTKAGYAGWKSIIPIYNLWVLCEIVGRPGWWGLTPILLVIPFVNIIAIIPVIILMIIVSLDLGKSFGKDTVWSVFLLIVFQIIGYLMLGFGSSKYVGPAAAGGAAPSNQAPTPVN
ncbi:signal peptidase I [Candidatus Saccharibacteria bacterium]|nr:signal peptidase I [Candidatus Saccharibacteria bacterium]